MTISGRKELENQIFTLVNSVSTRFEPKVPLSIMILHGGKPSHVSSWELEAMLDDLLTIENDSD